MRTTPLFRDKKTPLPSDFVLHPYSVRIGRGKTCSKAIGNRRLQVLASSFLEAYRKTSTKIEKSLIVTKIVDMIQEACPVGAFVRYQDGRWWEVDDFTARDKVGSTIRDLLSDEYRSSSKAKFARRKRQKQDSLTTGKVAAVVSNLDALSSDLPPCPQDQQKKMTVAKDPPQHQEVSEQGDNVAWSSESRGLDDEGLLFPIHGSSTKTQTAQRKKQRQDSLTDGTKSVIDSILDLRSSDLLFCPQDHQEKNMLATKNPPPIHHSLSSESRRLNDGNGMKPLGILVQQGRQSSLRVQMGLDGESQQPPRSRSTKTPVPENVGLEQKQSSLTTGTASVFGSNFYLMSLDLPLDPQDCQEMILGTENPPPEHQAVLEQGDEARSTESLKRGSRTKPLALNASSCRAFYQPLTSAKAERMTAKSQQPSFPSTGRGDFHDVDSGSDLKHFLGDGCYCCCDGVRLE